MEVHPHVLALAPDLTTGFPCSPRETLGGYIIAARALDKCRAKITGKVGPYLFDGFMDQLFFDFTGIKGAHFHDFVATGADNEAVARYIHEHALERTRVEIVKWNNEWRYKRLCEMPDRFQRFMERYVPHVLNPRQISKITYLFDIFDAEEGRLE